MDFVHEMGKTQETMIVVILKKNLHILIFCSTFAV